MRRMALALVALTPLAIGTSPAAARTLTAHICDSASIVRTVEIPLDDGQPAPVPCHSFAAAGRRQASSGDAEAAAIG